MTNKLAHQKLQLLIILFCPTTLCCGGREQCNNAEILKKYTMELIIFSIICGIAGGAIYQSKNRPFINGFLWAFLLGLIGLIVTIAKPTLKE